MKSSSCFVILMVLEALVLLPSFTSPVKAVANVDILSHTGYIDSFDYYHVVGEVQNIGDAPVNFVQVTATFYDSHNSVIDARFDLTMLYVIMPRCKSPFKIALLDVAKSAQVHNYSLSVSFTETSSLPIGVEIPTNFSYVDSDGYMHVVGELKNIGTEILVNPKVVATFYNEASKVVAAAMSNIDPEIVGEAYPNQTVPFEIVIDAERTQHVSTYVLTAESNQYIVIPELQLSTQLIILIGSTIIVLALRRKSSLKPKLSPSPS